MNKKMRALIFLAISAVIVALDCITKKAAVFYLAGTNEIKFIPGVLHFSYLENDGAALGMLDDARWVFMSLSTVAIIAMIIIVFAYKNVTPFLCVILAFLTGGGIGNMIDRISLGYVIDFLKLELIKFPYIFNVADVFVCVGCALALIYLIFFEKEDAVGKSNHE